MDGMTIQRGNVYVLARFCVRVRACAGGAATQKKGNTTHERQGGLAVVARRPNDGEAVGQVTAHGHAQAQLGKTACVRESPRARWW